MDTSVDLHESIGQGMPTWSQTEEQATHINMAFGTEWPVAINMASGGRTVY